MEYKFLDVCEVKIDDKPGSFSGYLSTFNNVDRVKDIVKPGAFDRSLKEHESAGTKPSLLWMHDDKEPIGEWQEMKPDSRGLKVKGQLWVGQGIPNADKAHMVLKSNQKKGLSIGYSTKNYSIDSKSGVRNLEDVDLHEGSIVGHCAANPKANVLAVKAMGIEAMVAQALEEILGEVLHKSNFAEKICIMELIQKKKLPDGLGDVSSFLRHLGVK
jgi:HK97 family phage prohead protease